MYFTLWEGPAPVVCRLGDSSGILPWWGGGFGTLPRGRSRHTYVTLRGGNPILYRVERGCVEHMCVVCGEPDRARYCFSWRGSGSYTVPYTVHGVLRCGMSRHIHGTLCGVGPAHAPVYNMLSLMFILIMQLLRLLVRVLNRHSTMQMRPTIDTV